MTKFISILIAVTVALFPILMLHSVNHIMAIIADVLLLFFAAALHSDHPKDEGPAIIFVAILISVISQIAWALLAWAIFIYHHMYELIPLPDKGNYVGEVIWNPDFGWQKWNGNQWEDHDV